MSNVAPFTRHSRIFSRNSRTHFASYRVRNEMNEDTSGARRMGEKEGKRRK